MGLSVDARENQHRGARAEGIPHEVTHAEESGCATVVYLPSDGNDRDADPGAGQRRVALHTSCLKSGECNTLDESGEEEVLELVDAGYRVVDARAAGLSRQDLRSSHRDGQREEKY